MNICCLIRNAPWYRRGAFVKGLRAAGHEVRDELPRHLGPEVALLIWNRYGHVHDMALQVERAGGTVLVAENGYLGVGGTSPKFDVHPNGPQPHHYYALSRGWHNGRGEWHAGGPERFTALGVDLKPWRAGGDYVLVCPNRAFGVGEQLMHPDWGERTADRLRKLGHKVRLRGHPGNDKPKRGIEEDLAGASAVHIWSSSAGVHALAQGIPVTCLAPYWICKGAGDGKPISMSRRDAMERMAWAQWTLAEIESGEPFANLLPAAK